MMIVTNNDVATNDDLHSRRKCSITNNHKNKIQNNKSK